MLSSGEYRARPRAPLFSDSGRNAVFPIPIARRRAVQEGSAVVAPTRGRHAPRWPLDRGRCQVSAPSRRGYRPPSRRPRELGNLLAGGHRLRADLSPDASFGKDGGVGAVVASDLVFGLATDANGDIVMGTTTDVLSLTSAAFILQRYHP